MLDDDFFEIDEDLLNAAEYSQKIITENEGPTADDDVSYDPRELHCCGEDQLGNQSFHEKSFIMNNEVKLIENRTRQFYNHKLFDMDISPELMSDTDMLNNLINKARVNAQSLFVSSRENSTFITKKSYFSLRHQVTTFLFQLRELLYTGQIKHNVADDVLRPFVMYLEQLNTLPITDILHTVHSTLGNQSTSPGHHLLHGHIEWRWIFLIIRLRIELDKCRDNLMLTENTLRNTEFEEKLQMFIYDLIIVSVAIFNRLHTSEIPTKSPFLCVCIKEMWLLVQLLVDRFHESQNQLNSFWSYFNTAMNWLQERKVPFNEHRVTSIARDTNNIYPKDYTLFALWLLNGVAMLHGFNENGTFIGSTNGRVRENSELLDSLLKAFTATDISEQNLRASLLIMQSLLLTWWPKKCELIMSFWECFHKKLNSSFFLNGACPSSMAVAGKTVPEYLEQATRVLITDKLDNNTNSYTIFLILLAKVLDRFQQADSKNQIMKVKGRILTKFGESKLFALNEIGIHNLLSLFLMISSKIGVKEIGPQLQNILLLLRLEKLPAPRQSCLMKGHMSMVLLGMDQEFIASSYISRILDQVSKVSSTEAKLPMLRLMAGTLEFINERKQYLDYGGLTLMDNWVVDYLSFSQQSEQEKCLQVMDRLIVCLEKDAGLRSRNPGEYNKITQIVYKSVLPHVKNAYRQCNIFSGVPEIASTLCVYATGQNGVPSFKDLFQYFTEALCCDIQVTIKFLLNILKSECKCKVDPIAAIRQWIRCSTLLTSSNDDIRTLTACIMELNAFKLLCDATPDEVITAKEPLSIFFSTCGKMYQAADDAKRKQIAINFQAALSGFEKWVPLTESPPAIFKIHIVIALIVFNCPHIVYTRSQPSCFFSIVMNHYILPLSLLVEKPQKLITIQAVHKIWHLIVGAIEKLDFVSDAQLQKVLSDMIVKWIPQFRLMLNQKQVSKPFTTLAHHCKESTLTIVLEKMVATFLTSQRRETHQNSALVMVILAELLSDNSNRPEMLVVQLKATIVRMFEHAMMVDESLPSRTMVFNFLTNIFRTPAYMTSNSVRNTILAGLKAVTNEKNMSYYSSFYFQFMTKFAKINHGITQEFMPHVRQQVKVVEELRGAGQDANLRNLLNNLECLLLQLQ